MSIDLEHIRSRKLIEDVVGEKFSLKQSGKPFIGVEHDSMGVVPASGMYFWNSRCQHGDVFDFVGRYHLNYGSGWNNRDPQHIMEVLEHLVQDTLINIERRFRELLSHLDIFECTFMWFAPAAFNLLAVVSGVQDAARKLFTAHEGVNR